MAEAISSGSDGLIRIPSGPAISGMAEVFEVMTGVPQAIASRMGMPKLSRRDVYMKADAPL